MTHADDRADNEKLAFEPARVALARIGVNDDRGFQEAMSAAAEIATEVLGVGRLSVWLYIDQRRAVRCDYVHQSVGNVFAGPILRTADFPNYFRAMEVNRVVPVANTASDPIVDEFREAYFAPLGISAMLDAPMYQGGDVVGIVCHEHLGEPREWTRDECEFAAAMSSAVARLYAENASLRTDHLLSAYQQHVDRLGDLSNFGRLAAGMAHDFGNILAAIVSSANLIIDSRPDDTDLINLASGILDATDRAAALNASLMALGQNEMRRPRVIDPRTLVERFQNVLSMAVGTQVELLVSADQTVGWVFVDPSELERVLLNLVVNARDAMPNGGQVRLGLRESRERRRSGHNGRFVVIEVGDKGLGMDGDTVKHMFDPFFTTKGTNGTGLGLAIVQQIVVLSGGFVDVESVPGGGTTIRVFLPAIGTR